MRWQGEAAFFPRRHLIHGVAIGALFALNSFPLLGHCIHGRVEGGHFSLHASVFRSSRRSFSDGRRPLTLTKIFGLLLAFSGLVSVFGGKPATYKPLYWVGDLMEVGAGFLWAATTVYIRNSCEQGSKSLPDALCPAFLFHSDSHCGLIDIRVGQPLAFLPLCWPLCSIRRLLLRL